MKDKPTPAKEYGMRLPILTLALDPEAIQYTNKARSQNSALVGFVRHNGAQCGCFVFLTPASVFAV